MPIVKRACLVLFVISASACSGPTSPTTTRIIGLSGNLEFGNVKVGQSVNTTLTITNSGNSTLTVTGMTGPTAYTANWTSGTIPAGGSQSVSFHFAPPAAQHYDGTLTVNGDQTSGTNTISVSGTGLSVPVTAEAFCATLPNTGYGNAFFCGTNQGNLNRYPFPDGSLGYCQYALANNLGLVGYSAYTYSGGTFLVDTQSGASATCNGLGSGICGGYIRCTRQ
jgi:hypothetical protein